MAYYSAITVRDVELPRERGSSMILDESYQSVVPPGPGASGIFVKTIRRAGKVSLTRDGHRCLVELRFGVRMTHAWRERSGRLA